MAACEPLRQRAGRLDIHLSEVPGYREWREEARRLSETGQAILADEDSHGPWLDRIAAGRPRAKLAIDQLRNRIEEGRVEAPKTEERPPRREPAPKKEEGIAHILDDPEKLAELRKQREERERQAQEEIYEFSRLRAAVYDARTDEEARIARQELDAYIGRETAKNRAGDDRRISEARERGTGQAAPRETPEERERQSERVHRRDEAAAPAGMDTAPARPDVRTLHEALQRDWNRLDERADRFGVSVFDMEGSEPLIRRMRALAENPDLPAGPRQVLAGVLENHRRYLAARKPDTVAAASPAPEAIPSLPARKPADEALARHSVGLGFAVDNEAGPAGADTPGVLSVLRRAAGRIAGGRDYHDRMETEMHARQALEQWEALKGEWNRLLERADREGVHVIYTDGYDNLYERLGTLSRNRLLDYDISSEMRAVLSKLDRAVSNRRYVDTWRGLMTGELDSREALEAEAAGRGVAVPDHKKYDTWRDLIDDAADRCRQILADRHEYGVHLDDIARRGESLASALTRVRDILREDDRHLAAALVQQHKGEDVAEREKRIARLLDDPGKLRELRQKRAEQKAGKKQRRDRSMSMGM